MKKAIALVALLLTISVARADEKSPDLTLRTTDGKDVTVSAANVKKAYEASLRKPRTAAQAEEAFEVEKAVASYAYLTLEQNRGYSDALAQRLSSLDEPKARFELFKKAYTHAYHTREMSIGNALAYAERVASRK